MAPRLKQNYPELIVEYDRRVRDGETTQAIRADFHARGIHWGTFQNHRTKTKQTALETPMPEDTVEVLPGQMDLDADPVPDEPVSTPVDLVPVHEISEPLAPVEVETLEHYEQIIERGLKTFVEVGHALAVIRDQRLYREHYATFDAYVRQRWDFERSYAHRMIEASEVMDHLLPIGNMLPVNEAQARPLTSLAPEQQVEVWQEAVETAPAWRIGAARRRTQEPPASESSRVILIPTGR